MGGPGQTYATKVAVDTNANGVEQGTQYSGGSGAALIWSGPLVDASGDCYVAGWFQGTASFGTNMLQAQGYWDVFLAKLGASSATPLSLSAVWTNDLPEFGVTSEPGSRVEILTSTNLATPGWTALQTITNTTGRFPFMDAGWTLDHQRFYRARQLP